MEVYKKIFMCLPYDLLENNSGLLYVFLTGLGLSWLNKMYHTR